MLTLLSAASSSSYLFSYQPFSEAPLLWTNSFLGRISGILKFHPVFEKSLLDGVLCLQCLVDPGDLSKLKKPYTHLPILPTIRHVLFILGLFPNMNMSPKIQGLRLSTPHVCWNLLCQQLDYIDETPCVWCFCTFPWNQNDFPIAIPIKSLCCPYFGWAQPTPWPSGRWPSWLLTSAAPWAM